MLEFAAAAAASEAGEDEDVIEVGLAGRVMIARRPTTAQYALFTAAQVGTGADQVAAIFDMLVALFGVEDARYVQSLIKKRAIDIPDLLGGSDQNPDGGIIDSVLSEFAARPTQPSTGSSSSQVVAGRKSTGRSAGRGSTHSTSPSTGSSTSSSSGRRNASTPK